MPPRKRQPSQHMRCSLLQISLLMSMLLLLLLLALLPPHARKLLRSPQLLPPAPPLAHCVLQVRRTIVIPQSLCLMSEQGEEESAQREKNLGTPTCACTCWCWCWSRDAENGNDTARPLSCPLHTYKHTHTHTYMQSVNPCAAHLLHHRWLAPLGTMRHVLRLADNGVQPKAAQ